MVNLIISNNIVMLNKKDPNSYYFVNSFLTKYETVTKVDYLNSTKYKKKLTSIKECRNLYSETGEFIIFSRGILELVPSNEYTCTYINQRPELISPSLSFEDIKTSLPTFPLRDDQIIAVNKCLSIKRGVIQLPTAIGKSAIITAVIKRLHEQNPDMKSLVIAPTLSTVNNINNTLNENGIPSIIYGHPDKNLASVTTGLVQSLADDQSVNLSEIDAVFYDECLPANSQILLADGSYKPISEIYNNETINEVLSYNIETDSYVIKRILKKYKSLYNDRFCKVYYIDYLGKTRGVVCTPNHKIYTKNRGYVPAAELTSEDIIKIDYEFTRNWKSLTNYTYVNVKKVVFNIGKVVAYKYNLEIEGTHCYFANNVLVSNCHHLKCDTWNTLNSKLINAQYSLGFSALSIDKKEIYKTDFRELSYDAALITGSSGRVLMHMDPKYYIDKGIIALPIIMRINNFCNLPADLDESNWHDLVKYGLMSSLRTNIIAQISQVFYKYNRKVLILVSEKDYAFLITKFLVQYGITKIGISFGASVGYTYKSHLINENEIIVDYNNENSLDVVEKLSNGDLNILIATSHLDEGVDIKTLDVCILACGGKKDRKLIQRVGRVLRKSKSGKYAYIIDFADHGSRVLSRQSNLRFKMYEKDIGVPIHNIYDNIPIDELENIFKNREQI